MRIVDSNSVGNSGLAPTGRAGETQSGRSTANSGSKPAAGDDTVDLSGASNRIAGALKAHSAARAHRVHQLKAAVQSGTYEPNSAAISKAMVNEALSGGDE